MAMYARSTLTNWDGASGAGDWSNTSGGASNGSYPGSSDDVVFDANSGASRTITVSNTPQMRNITTVGANAMTFDLTGGQINIYGAVTLTGTAAVIGAGSLALQGATNLSILASGVPISNIWVVKSGNASVSLGANLTLTNQFYLSGGVFDANTYNVTADHFRFEASNVGDSCNLSTGTWTVTGTSGTLWNTAYEPVNGSSATIKLTGVLTGNASWTDGSVTNSYGTIWNATTGGFDVQFTWGVPQTITTFKASAGSNNKFMNGGMFTATNWLVDGTGAAIKMWSDSASVSTTLAKAGGGTVNMDYVDVKRVTASPAATFRARNSVDSGNNTNWTFVPANSKFMTFF